MKSIMDKSFFLIGGFLLTYNIMILGGTNNVMHFSVKNISVHSVEPGTSKKVLK